MLTWFQAALLGVVQGLTEFLPVSSTAHLLIGERLLGFEDPASVFTEMIQLGSILAIVWLYRDRLIAVARTLPSRVDSRRFVVAVFVAFVPAVIAGLFLSDFVERVLHQSLPTIAAAFVAGGVVMLAVERFGPRPRTMHVEGVTVAQAFGVGLSQVLALVPGVSRSGATIVGGMLVGLDRSAAAEFSFFLAMPTMAGAFAHSLLELRSQVTADRIGTIAIGFVMAFLASLVVVKPFLGAVRRSGFAPFAVYRIVVGVALIGAVARGLL